MRVVHVVLKIEKDPPDMVYLGIQTEVDFIKLLTSFVVLRDRKSVV